MPSGMRSRKQQQYEITRAEAKKLKAKGIIIVGIAIGNGHDRDRIKSFLTTISTAGQTLTTTYNNLVLLNDTVVCGFCPRPALGETSFLINLKTVET